MRLREIARGVAVAGKDRGAVAVFMVHGKAERLFIVLGAHRGQDGSEDFFFVDVHVLGDVVEQVRADEKAVLIALQVEVAAIDHQLGALIDTGLHQTFGCSLWPRL